MDTLSDLVRRPQGIVAVLIEAVGAASVRTSIKHHRRRRALLRRTENGSTRVLRQVSAILATLPVLHFEPLADQAYAAARVHLERSDPLIGGNDILIASQALALDLTMVTAEFGRVSNQKTENVISSSCPARERSASLPRPSHRQSREGPLLARSPPRSLLDRGASARRLIVGQRCRLSTENGVREHGITRDGR